MKGELLLKALDVIENFAYTTGDFIDVFLSSSKSNYSAMRNFRPRWRKTFAESMLEKMRDNEKERKKLLIERKKFYDLLRRCKRDGLISKSKRNNKIIWELTERGKIKKADIILKLTPKIRMSEYNFEPAKELVIIIFDIPEKERSKRNWLRSVLINFKFKMLQKSVWMGKYKIPKEFISDLKEYEILDYVEIFVVSKSGTIKQIV